MSDWHIAAVSSDNTDELSIRTIRQLTDEERASTEAALVKLDDVLDRMLWRVLQNNYEHIKILGGQIASILGRRDIPMRDAQDVALTAAVTAIVNFLAAMRMHLDQSELDLNRMDEKDNGERVDTWKRVCSAEYDDHFAYRFLYRFRNYVLHRGRPISTFKMTQSAADLSSPNAAEPPHTQVFLGEEPQVLIEQYDGWSAVEDDLAALSTPIDLIEQIEIAMECLARVEQAYITTLLPEIRQAAETLRAVLGDLDSVSHSLVVAQFPQHDGGPLLTLQFSEIDIDRVRLAMRLTAHGEAITSD